MAGGSITRITGGTFSTILEGGLELFNDKFDIIAGKKNNLGGKQGTVKDVPKSPPPPGKYFVRGYWTDDKDRVITKALIGSNVKFHIQMDKSKAPAGSEINFILKDWDGAFNLDDAISLTSTVKDPKTGTYPKITSLKTDANGKATLFISLTEGLISFIDDDGGAEIELYLSCTYYDKTKKEFESLDLPDDTNKYLIVYEKEVLITVFVELPHSKETGWGGKGLAGHSAMAIGERYFDYGPNNAPGKYSEKEYDVDFNNDGDKDDIVQLDSPSFMNAPGRPWWGKMIADEKGIKPGEVKLSDVISFISRDWTETNIYGEIHKFEFYVKESESKKMIVWWLERYNHLKIYSVWPWKGEQCTTAVKTAIQQAFPSSFTTNTTNLISDDTQKPSGLISELKKFVSTSKELRNKAINEKIIKPEAKNWTP